MSIVVKCVCFLVLGMGICFSGMAQDLMSDTWVATDALGREMPTANDAGNRKQDKKRVVGMFYVTWHDEGLYNVTASYKDVTQVLSCDSIARISDNSKAWPQGVWTWHWGEPEYGYFLSRDEYVIRHDLSMLTDAGVDVIILDVTNAVEYWEEWKTLFKTMEEVKNEGNEVPKFCFWAFNGPVVNVVQHLYENIYKQECYKDLWFYWEGKPLMLYNARPELDANQTHETKESYSDDVKAFFTLRNMWWGYYEWGGERYVGTEDAWSFDYEMNDERVAGLTPKQRAAVHKGRIEEMAVTPAQHPMSITGKCWRKDTKEPKLNDRDMPEEAFVPWLGKTVKDPVAYGIYFQDRWNEALEADPDFLYLNDWNEWTAIKFKTGKAPNMDAPGPESFLGRNENSFYFVDQYNAEYNRTIQPMKGGYTDNYYMQMVQNIRRYKGVRPVPESKGYKEIRIDGNFDDWVSINCNFLDTRGDVFHRHHKGYAGRHYDNITGRNDIVESKVAVDAKNVYFYVKTDKSITPYTDKNWMLLLIDADKNKSTGWFGYDYIINKEVSGIGRTWVMTYSGKEWVKLTEIDYRSQGNEMEITVPRKLTKWKGNHLVFDFKWADNPQGLTDPISLCTDGDTAPNRRFNYRMIWCKR